MIGIEANRTHTPPPRVENLGEGTFYYNLDVVRYRPKDEQGNDMPYYAYDYLQVRVQYPIKLGEIQRALKGKGIAHQINADDFLIDADSGKVQAKEKEIDYTDFLPTTASEKARQNLINKNWKLHAK